MSICPINRNSCFDPDEDVPQVAFCQPSNLDVLLAIPLGGLGVLATEIGFLASGDSPIDRFCNFNGGLGAKDTGFTQPEWFGRTFGQFGDCLYDDEDVPCSFLSRGCSGTHCAVPGIQGLCTKKENYGDPLVCCLRDYQCNDGGDVFGKTCFSADNTFATCPAEFRATDTKQCGFLTEQYCLGNYSEADGSTPLPAGLDFTALWVDTGIDGNPFVVNALKTGTRYPLNGDRPCTISELDPKTGKPKSGTTCQLSGVVPAVHDQSSYQTGDIPICQKIFWRNLYGNEPTFKNNNWKTAGGPTDCTTDSGARIGDTICANTSLPPQTAACISEAFGGEPTPTGIVWAQSMLTAVYNKLKAKGVLLTSTIATGSDQPFTDFLYSVCKKYPILCESFLQQECGSVDPIEFQTNKNAWDWCGCYMADSQYQKYTDSFGVTKECTPFCNVPNTIPLTNGDTTQPLFCQQSVCIIDDVAINLVKTHFQSTNNNINFSQVCSACGSGYAQGTNNQSTFANNSTNSNLNNVSTSNCQCILNNFTLNSLNSTITGDGINISQACNGNSKCYNSVTNSDGTQSSNEVDCANNNTSINQTILTKKAAQEKKAKDTTIYWGILLAVIVVGVIVILWILLAGRKLPENDYFFKHKEKVKVPAPIQAPLRPAYQPYSLFAPPMAPPIVTVPPVQNITVNPPTDLSGVNKSLKENTGLLASLQRTIDELRQQVNDYETVPLEITGIPYDL
jgi:hypothetical protein